MNAQLWNLLATDTGATIYMTLVSTLFGYLIGLPLGIILTVTDKDGVSPHPVIYRIIDVVTNIMRSIPFIILLMILIPFTRWLIGKSYGPTATIIPLVISAAPYISRMVESSLDEVDKGVVEAARSMGANNWTIIFRVLLPEAKTSLIVGATITLGTVLGYTAMAGTIGGGGLGADAKMYGYQRGNMVFLGWTIVILVVLFQIFQMIGMKVAQKTDHRK
ncbi:methionine ABC transporter permease [Porcincola intestinalis]|uniref:ABC transporter permease n=2 Tax=Porcincola intestinalis TaxID=2606632 RepID=A0A6L5X421_9FIRM|nr:methionine ABC transporter permease [Porcincola intestinalis]MCI6699407.1 ABC transporter permease [Lachnospiraceae bacterium]MCI6768111.1 ABC transporter permease [Lachnospiraceae bacterium]MCI7093508.1 ABC transporter permease [Lachnospiraceae bacterium]MDD6439504.1 ABC transporter permease [Lachnospiraceae bacterium]MDD7060572.1 ABC transporter permease [Porcincola intestinalis]